MARQDTMEYCQATVDYQDASRGTQTQRRLHSDAMPVHLTKDLFLLMRGHGAPVQGHDVKL